MQILLLSEKNVICFNYKNARRKKRDGLQRDKTTPIQEIPQKSQHDFFLWNYPKTFFRQESGPNLLGDLSAGLPPILKNYVGPS
jgi:hypothetical protein